MEINDKVVIVTGASAGIGLATARYLSSQGARLVLAARNADKLQEVAQELPGSLAVPTDVTRPEDAKHLVERTVAEFGRIDVLVNGAARAMAKPVEHINLDEYRDTLELNVLAPLNLMQLVIPHMRQQGGGTILNISSQASRKHIPYIAGYASTKYALNALSLTAREELAAANITVSVILPGIVETGFGQNTPSPEPDSLRHAPDGALLPHVILPETVAERIGDLIRSGDAELDLPEP
jgi:NADP-dependent 3-hydroxy acid dehydrogenase YdfG